MKSVFLFITILFTSNIYAQTSDELYMPKEIKNAYKNKTRSLTGSAGENYFVNNADYKIKVNFNPETYKIKGSEIISYTNNSNDTLKLLYFNLFMDLFKKGNARDWDMGKVDVTEGINISKFTINGNEIDINSKNISNYQSILRIKLEDYFLPNSTNTISINWDFIFNGNITVRSGQYGNKNFLIAYWFPKIAVYDDIVGWNTTGHTGMQEFYSEFGNYYVEITVPGKYNVWSTAILQNTQELYTKKYINRINKSKNSDEVIHIITEQDRKEANILKESDNKTWIFKGENTPDFAFGISKTYLWDATSVISGKNRISINAVYKENTKDFREVAEISQNIIRFFSTEIPALPYPYPQFTAFNGGGGMEFPGMINDGDQNSYNSTLYLTAHELGHSYYPFQTGLNEQKYAWMDEGLISFFPRLFVQKHTKEKDYNYFRGSISYYNFQAGLLKDLPLMVPSDHVKGSAYRFQAYLRSSVAFYELYKLIGQEKFTECLQLFTKRWNGKHPIPYDLFFTFNEAINEDLSWFWQAWFFNFGAADLSIGKLKTNNKKTYISINNKGTFPVGINLKVTYSNDSIKEYKYKSSVWKNTNTFEIELLNNKIYKIELDTLDTPDAFPEDNVKVYIL